jgi:hypothetical protein
MHFLLISGSPVKGIAITPQKQGVWRTASNRPQLHYAPEGGICQGLLDTPHTRPVGGPVRIRLRLCRSVGQVVLTCPRPSEARRVPLRGTPARAGEHRRPPPPPPRGPGRHAVPRNFTRWRYLPVFK